MSRKRFSTTQKLSEARHLRFAAPTTSFLNGIRSTSACRVRNCYSQEVSSISTISVPDDNSAARLGPGSRLYCSLIPKICALLIVSRVSATHHDTQLGQATRIVFRWKQYGLGRLDHGFKGRCNKHRHLFLRISDPAPPVCLGNAGVLSQELEGTA